MLGFDLLKSGIFSVLPWVTMALAANLGGFIADSLVSRGVSVTTVRKVMQTVRARLCKSGNCKPLGVPSAVSPPEVSASCCRRAQHICLNLGLHQ